MTYSQRGSWEKECINARFFMSNIPDTIRTAIKTRSTRAPPGRHDARTQWCNPSLLYARVITIFRVVAYCAGDDLEDGDDTEPELTHVLWVRCFDLDTRAPGGFNARCLPRVGWAALDGDAFGFVAPDQVLRAAHLKPAFAHSQSDAALPGHNVAYREDEDDVDWNYHYVGMYVQLHFYSLRMLIEPLYSFVDRDIL